MLGSFFAASGAADEVKPAPSATRSAPLHTPAPAPALPPGWFEGTPFVVEHTSLAERSVAVVEAPSGNAPASMKAAPVAATRPDMEPAASAPAVPMASPMVDPRAGRRAIRVLVVDDEPDIRTVVSSALRRLDVPVEVAEAEDGLDAIEKVKAATPDLVVLDVMMPRMDGFETCRALRENVRTAFVPILMLTASADQDSRTKGYLVGTDDYMSKPFTPLDLKMRISRLLRRTYGI